MQVSKEQIESARSANLAEFFISNGYETEQHGNELHVRGFGGLYVNTSANSWFQFSEQRGDKNPVNCLTNVLGMSFTDAVSALSNVSYSKSYKPTEKSFTPAPKEKAVTEKQNVGLPLPENEHYKNRIFAYLVKERCIDPELVKELVDKKLLYQGTIKYIKDGEERAAQGNAVFVQKDKEGNVVGAEIHGTNTYKRFKAIAGSGDENVFSYAIGTPKKVYAFESAIDLLSFKMLANPEKIKDSLLVSMGGLKPKVLKEFEAQGLKIISCVDNDERGKKFNEANNFQSGVRKLSEENVKDWNELLKKRVKELSTIYNLSENNSVKKPEKHSFNKPSFKK